MNWRHSGFSVYAGKRIARDDKAGQEALAHHIMRNAFAEEKITYIEDTGAGVVSLGQRRKEGMLRPGDKPLEKEDGVDFTILDVSDYDPPHVPSKT